MIITSWEGDSTGRDVSPHHCTRLFFVSGLLPAAPIPIPIPKSSKRQPPNRTKLLPSWRVLMSYRSNGLRPEQRGDTFFSQCPPLLCRRKPAALGETSRICRTEILEIPECQSARVRNLGRHPPSSVRAGPDSAVSRTVIASHPFIPSWALARGRP